MFGKKKKKVFPSNEKVTLKGVDVGSIVDTVVGALTKLQEAFHAAQDQKYGPAMSAILSVIMSLFVEQVLPHIKGGDAKGENKMSEDDKQEQEEEKQEGEGKPEGEKEESEETPAKPDAPGSDHPPGQDPNKHYPPEDGPDQGPPDQQKPQ